VLDNAPAHRGDEFEEELEELEKTRHLCNVFCRVMHRSWIWSNCYGGKSNMSGCRWTSTEISRQCAKDCLKSSKDSALNTALLLARCLVLCYQSFWKNDLVFIFLKNARKDKSFNFQKLIIVLWQTFCQAANLLLDSKLALEFWTCYIARKLPEKSLNFWELLRQRFIMCKTVI